MALFGRRKKKSLFDKPNRPEIKSKRRVFGRASISQTKSPYANTHQAGLSPKLKIRKKVRKTPVSALARPPGRLTGHKNPRWKKILIVILSLFIIGGLTYVVYFTDYFQINDFQIYDEGTVITNNLKLNELVTQSLLNQNILLFNETALSAQILKDNPQYKFAQVKKVFPKSIEIDLEEFPVAANIINTMDGADGLKVEKKFEVNTNGMTIVENDENPDLPYIRISSKEALSINSYPLDHEKLDYIIKLVNLFEEKFGLKVVEANYLKPAREVHLRTEKGFDVWFDLTKNMLPQIDKLKRALPKLDIYNTPLQYIDLRITSANAEKVIYKKK